MRLIYGTQNTAKLHVMRKALTGLPLEIVGLRELEALPRVEIDESGDDPLTNATLKARAYYRALGEPVFSCDTGLYLDGLPAELQPGVHVRRVNGKLLTDEEMQAYYGGLAREYGMLRARYHNAICVVWGEEREQSSMDDSLSGNWFGIVDKVYPGWKPGFPLDAMSVRLSDGTPWQELGKKNDEGGSMPGFRRFFEEMLKVWKPEDGLES